MRTFLVDLSIVLVFCACHACILSVSPSEDGQVHWWPLLVSIPVTFTLLLRHRAPWVVLIMLVAVEYVLTAVDADTGLLYLAELVALYSVCVRANWIGTVIGSTLPMLLMTLQFFKPVINSVTDVATTVVGVIMVVGWARAMNVSRQRAEHLEGIVALLGEARDQIAVDAAVVERVRIAREFHDIVSHNLSVVALRAGVARTLVDQDRDHARATLRELESTSRTALEEMRYCLGALSTNDAGGFGSAPGEREELDRQPAPRLNRVDDLIDGVKDAGVDWTLRRRGVVREFSSSLEVTAYRVAQEAVTNVLKHACAGQAQVLLDYGARTLKVEVSNRVARAVNSLASVHIPKALPTAGHGLIGLRERVALHGGTLTAHPVPGGFHVAALFPCTENPSLPVNDVRHREVSAGGRPDQDVIIPSRPVRRYRRIR